MPSSSKKRVGKYELGRTLGEGTFGKVKYAVDTTTGQACAIKILDKDKIQKQNMGAQIKKEISIMKMIHHKHIVRLHEVLASRSKIFIVLELITGGELFDKIVESKRFTEDVARFYFRQLITGVNYCHQQGVCHRDLKPENLLLDADGNLKISDFGLSALYTGEGDDASRATLLHTTCGTPNYVAPEVLSNEDGYDGRQADIWSCGVILYVLNAGFLPFDEPTMSALFKKIQRAEFDYPSWFSAELRDLIDHVLIVDPNERYTVGDIMKHPWFARGMDAGADASAGTGAGSGGATLQLTPSQKDMDEAVAEEVGDDAAVDDDDDASTPLNAFEVVNMFGSMALNRLLASTDQRRTVANSRFVSSQPVAKVLDTVREAWASLGGTCTIKGQRADCEILTKNGQVTLSVLVRSLTDDLQLVHVARGRGDVLAQRDMYVKLRESINSLEAAG